MFDKIRTSFVKCLSTGLVQTTDGELIVDASWGLGLAAIVIAICAWGAGVITMEPEVDNALVNFSHHSTLLLVLFIVFIVSVGIPIILSNKGQLKYLWATLCNAISFILLSLVIFFLVYWSGGIGSSVYGAEARWGHGNAKSPIARR